MKGKQLINVARDINGCVVQGSSYRTGYKVDNLIDGLVSNAWIPSSETSQISNPVLFILKKKYKIIKCRVCVNKTSTDISAKGIRIYYTTDNSLGINDISKFTLLGDFDFSANYQLLDVPNVPVFEASKIIIQIIDASYAVPRVEEIEFYSYENCYLVKDLEQKYYNLDDNKYNVETLKYDNLTITTNIKDLYDNEGLNSLSILNIEKTINNETFIPINKFNRFTIGKMVY